VFSYDGTELIVAAGTRTGRYKTPISGSHGFLLDGNLLSPDGSSIVVPFELSLLGGDDVLQSMRVVYVHGEHYAWSNDTVTYFDTNDMTIHSHNLADGKSQKIPVFGEQYRDVKYESVGIERCNNRLIASILFAETGKHAPAAVLIDLSQSSSQPIYKSSTSVSLSGSGGVCVISETRQVGDDEVVSYKMETESGAFGALAVPSLVQLPAYVAVSGRDCLVLGLQYPQSSIPGDSSKVNVVGLRISSPSYCRSR
jgi:hypothetical protein